MSYNDTDDLTRRELESMKYGHVAAENFWSYFSVGLHREVAKALARLQGMGKLPPEPLDEVVIVRLMGYNYKEALRLIGCFEKDLPYVENRSMLEYLEGLFTDGTVLC